jgi:site-specific recombinase XerD
MEDLSKTATITVTVFTRHSADCPKTDPQWKRCNCRKSLYIYADGKVTYRSAKTRSWEQAERAAQAERDSHDPVKLRLKEIADAESVKIAKATKVVDALDRWLKGHKNQPISTAKVYRGIAAKIARWAASKDVKYLKDVTPILLDEWRGEWSPDAEQIDNRLNATSQHQLLSKLRAFFGWASGLGLVAQDPARALKSIKPGGGQTWPLTQQQYEELLAAADKYDLDRKRDDDRRGAALRVIFQVQRWTGLRIGDVLQLARAQLVGNRLALTTQKTKADIDRIIPDDVAEALRSLPPQPNAHPDYFFWSHRSSHLSLTSRWTKRVKLLRPRLHFLDDHGKPLEFHSQMLRDTFAVEMLLAGMPLELVSRLLTHKSIKTTERYYARWVKAREKKLEVRMVEAMRKMGATVTM